jgi:hypothetical protein
MRFKIGDKVILGAHDYNEYNTYRIDWDENMDRYVGKVATLQKSHDGVAWYVDIDNGIYYWFAANMKPAYHNPDQKCVGCGVPAPHKDTGGAPFTCVFCIAEKTL